jgi:hypothetical protein
MTTSLPVHILSSHYGPLLADPASPSTYPGRLGRVLTSCLAIACLRAEGGVGPQVTSHVFGLKKAGDGIEGDAAAPPGVEEEGLGANWHWLTRDEGAEWVLGVVDRLVGEVGQVKSKL